MRNDKSVVLPLFDFTENPGLPTLHIVWKMASQQLTEYLSRLSATTIPEVRWTAVALALVLVVAALLIQPKEDTFPENVDLKIEAVC